MRKGSYHREQLLHRADRQPAGRGRLQGLVREVRRSHRDQALDAPADPHHAHNAEAGLPAHAHNGQLQPVEGMRRVGDAHGLYGERGYLNGG
ncbi:MAG: hypothetical protein M3P70_08605, partial [Actinomycetota bacterium]|nr:hypothetical protein [Actinomycetota bacterium]